MDTNASVSLLREDLAGRIRVPAAKGLQILEEFDRSGMSGLAFAELVGVIREIQATGATTFQSIAHCLTRRGISTRTGRTKWHPTQVRNILRNT